MTRFMQRFPWLVLCAMAVVFVLLPAASVPEDEGLSADERRAHLDAALNGPALTLHSLSGTSRPVVGNDGGVMLVEAGSVAVSGRNESFMSAPAGAPWMVRQRPPNSKRRRRDLSGLIAEADGVEDEDDLLSDAFGTTLEMDMPTEGEGWGWLVDEVVGRDDRASRVDRAVSGDILLRERYNNSMRGDPLSGRFPSADDILSYDGGLGASDGGRR